MKSLLNLRPVLKMMCRWLPGKWPGVWRLQIVQRVDGYRFRGMFVDCQTIWGYPIRAIANDMIGNRLYFYGTYQADLVDCMRSLIQPGDTVIDAGANIGILTIHMADLVGPSGRTFAVEPAQLTCECLRHNVADNHFSERVCVIQGALGDRQGRGTMVMPDPTSCTNYGGGRVVLDPTDDANVVQIHTLDDIWRENGCPHIRFIKFDIEGSEPAALRGARILFEESPPDACVVELNPSVLSETGTGTVIEIWDYFGSRGYKAYTLDGKAIPDCPAKNCDVLFRLCEG